MDEIEERMEELRNMRNLVLFVQAETEVEWSQTFLNASGILLRKCRFMVRCELSAKLLTGFRINYPKKSINTSTSFSVHYSLITIYAMLSLIKVFGISPSVDVQDWIHKGAIIVDVRTKDEFQTGHIKGSINVPLNALPGQLSKVPKDKLILTCCASGMRSSSAKTHIKIKRISPCTQCRWLAQFKKICKMISERCYI